MSKTITIEDDVWLASNVVVVDGVSIGKGSVVGAGAVVNKNLPPYSIAVGVPARVVKNRREAAAIHKSVEAQVHYGALEDMRK